MSLLNVQTQLLIFNLISGLEGSNKPYYSRIKNQEFITLHGLQPRQLATRYRFNCTDYYYFSLDVVKSLFVFQGYSLTKHPNPEVQERFHDTDNPWWNVQKNMEMKERGKMQKGLQARK